MLAVVLTVAAVYRSFGSPETGTGTLTLPQPAPNVGQQAPQFTAETVEGDLFELSDEGTYVLAFWSTLNRPSNQSREVLDRLAHRYGDETTFAVVYVNSAPQENGAPYIILQDSTGRLTSLYNVKRVPRLFVIRDGKIALVQNGYYEQYGDQLQAMLSEMSGESARLTGDRHRG